MTKKMDVLTGSDYKVCIICGASKMRKEFPSKGNQGRKRYPYCKECSPKVKVHKPVKHFILERDDYKCVYCGEEGRTVDHLVPASKGGTNTPSNIVCACANCNGKKKNLSVVEFLTLKGMSIDEINVKVQEIQTKITMCDKANVLMVG